MWSGVLGALLCLGTLPMAKGQCPTAACVPGSAPATSQSFGMGIFRVQLASLDTTTNGGADGYRDYSCSHGTILQRGSTYTLAVRTNPNADETVRAWVDFDNNGQFTVTEQVLASTARQHQAAFTVPATAVLGQPLRLRIAADYVNSAVPTPCSTPQYSQTEDYRVVLFATAPVRPMARFTTPDTVSCGAAVTFRDQSLNTPTAWRWAFGDGTSSTQQHPQHLYAQPGTYAVRLRACNATGCDSLTKTNYILVRADAPLPAPCQPPTRGYCCGFGLTHFRLGPVDRTSADGSVGYEDFSCAQRATLTSDRPYSLQLITGANAHDVRIYLDRNDNGQFDLPGELLYEGLNVRSPSVVVQVASGPGLVVGRPLRLRCWVDAAGNTPFGPCVSPQQGQVEDYSVVMVANTAAPTAAFSVTYQQLCGPVQVAVSNTTTGGATSYQWNFGDGTIASGATPAAHTYATGGVYILRLVVNNAFGADTATSQVLVADKCPVYCVPDGVGGTQEWPAYFTRVQVGTLDNIAFRGPGVPYRNFTAQQATLQAGQSYTLRTESLPWQFAGNGPWVRLLAWIDYDQSGTFTSNESLGMALSFSPQRVTFSVPLWAKPGATRLRIMAVGASEGFNTWSSCPESLYNSSTEEYTVLLAPAAAAPRAGFRADLSVSCSGTVQLRDTSWAMPTRWNWSFGDGATSSLQHPQHTYAQTGTYTISLQVSNLYGMSSATWPAGVVVTAFNQGPRPAACVPVQSNIPYGEGLGATMLGSLTYIGLPNDVAYRDESCSRPPLSVVAGASCPVRIDALKNGTSHMFVWVDANNDGVFDQTAELLFDSRSQPSSANPKIGLLTVPLTAVRNMPLRLRLYWLPGSPQLVPNPCAVDQGFGQIRDFTILATTPLATHLSGNSSTTVLYPNPTSGWLTLQSQTLLRGPVQVRNTTGQLVVEQDAIKTPAQTLDLDLHQLPDGIYFLHLPQSQLVRKITIMH